MTSRVSTIIASASRTVAGRWAAVATMMPDVYTRVTYLSPLARRLSVMHLLRRSVNYDTPFHGRRHGGSAARPVWCNVLPACSLGLPPVSLAGLQEVGVGLKTFFRLGRRPTAAQAARDGRGCCAQYVFPYRRAILIKLHNEFAALYGPKDWRSRHGGRCGRGRSAAHRHGMAGADCGRHGRRRRRR